MRDFLHVNKLQHFLEWCENLNIPIREGRGNYQEAQVYWQGGWHAIYKRANTHAGNETVHLTVPKQLQNLVKKYVYSTVDLSTVVTGRVQSKEPNLSNPPRNISYNCEAIPGCGDCTVCREVKIEHTEQEDDGVVPWD